MSIEESIQSVVANTYIVAPSAQRPDQDISEPTPTHRPLSSPRAHKSSAKQSAQRKCGMCNTAGDSDNELITCSLCGMSGHAISCLNCSPQLLKRIKESSHWECPNCKKCNICGRKDVEQELIICTVCDKGFHSPCIKLSNNNFTGFAPLSLLSLLLSISLQMAILTSVELNLTLMQIYVFIIHKYVIQCKALLHNILTTHGLKQVFFGTKSFNVNKG